jgi:hypothetical protein
MGILAFVVGETVVRKGGTGLDAVGMIRHTIAVSVSMHLMPWKAIEPKITTMDSMSM